MKHPRYMIRVNEIPCLAAYRDSVWAAVHFGREIVRALPKLGFHLIVVDMKEKQVLVKE